MCIIVAQALEKTNACAYKFKLKFLLEFFTQQGGSEASAKIDDACLQMSHLNSPGYNNI